MIEALRDRRKISLPFTTCLLSIVAGLKGLDAEADPSPRRDMDMYKEGHTITDATLLPLNMLDALRVFDEDTVLKETLGEEFSAAFLKLKMDEWNDYASHLTQWERDNTLDV